MNDKALRELCLSPAIFPFCAYILPASPKVLSDWATEKTRKSILSIQSAAGVQAVEAEAVEVHRDALLVPSDIVAVLEQQQAERQLVLGQLLAGPLPKLRRMLGSSVTMY